MKHHRVYKMLIGYGHSGAKALEIIIDAQRGDRHALGWIRFIRRINTQRPDI